MKSLIQILVVAAAMGILPTFNLMAQDEKKATETSATTGTPDKSKTKMLELEAKFKAAMTKATFKGRSSPVKDGVPGSDDDVKYSIKGVNKVGLDVWILTVRIQVEQVDLELPVPVKVAWAGETPMIVVNDLSIPGAGNFSARVMIHDKMFAGMWTGEDESGLLSGVITNEP